MVRVIPILLMQDKGLVKTVNFKTQSYIGDPINAVRIFNEKEVDELVLCDITASKRKSSPDYLQIKRIVSECFMPVAYGGGISNLDQIKRIIDLGVEKIIISSAGTDYKLLESAASIYGTQSIVVSIDVKKNIFGGYKVYGVSGTICISDNPAELATKVVCSGAGEIIVQSIDREGCMNGYDIKITKLISDSVNVPVVASGGCGSLLDIQDVLLNGGASSAAAGSLFVFKGKHKAVLINYPGYDELGKFI
jgi:cyclase